MESILQKLSVMLVPGMLAIVCHEVAHGYIAWRLGDPTAKMEGRLTLNPIKHIDIIGTLMIFFVGIGWAKPVPVVIQNLRNPKRDMIWVAAAGPVTNIILAIISGILLRGIELLNISAAHGPAQSMFVKPVVMMLAFSIHINLLLAIFNMIPLPPLDGGRILVGLLPWRQAEMVSRIEPYGMLIIIVAVFILPRYFGIDILDRFIDPLLSFGTRILAG